MDTDFDFHCIENHTVKYEKGVMCEWNKFNKKEFYFFVGDTQLSIVYHEDEDYNTVLEIIEDLKYSKYLPEDKKN